MCCIGCKAVAEFIEHSGLAAFYEFRSTPDPALDLTPEQSEWTHFDSAELVRRYVHENQGLAEAIIEVGGMYCSACVWLLDNAMQQMPGVESVTVNSSSRRAVVRWDSTQLSFGELLAAVARIGFKPLPLAMGGAASEADDDYRRSLKRLIVAATAGMQVMMFAVGLYAGDYFGIDRKVEQFLRIISLLVTLPIVFYSARPFFEAAWRGVRTRSPGMDLPVSIAIASAFIASVYATLLGRGTIYFDSVAMFVFFLSASRFLEMRARHRSDDHALALSQLLPDTAIRLRGGQQERVPLERLRTDDVITVRLGDVVPADGVLVVGQLSVDESMLTGESMPVERGAGGEMFAGGVVRSGYASVRVTRIGASTSLSEIGRLLERAKSDRPPIVQLADRIASKFVIAVLLVSAAAAGLWLYLDPARAFDVALATLVVTCPCALALATPAALAAATSRLAGMGFLLLNSRVLDVLGGRAVIVFDKTGTLTVGRPAIMQAEVIATGRINKHESLGIAAVIEAASEHVLARAFAEYCGHDLPQPSGIETKPGLGVAAELGGHRYRVGSGQFVAELSASAAPVQPDNEFRTLVYLGDEEGLLARFAIADELRADAAQTIRLLKASGFATVIASGDRPAAVQQVAQYVGVDAWHAGLSPAAKLRLIADIQAQGHKVAMVGDGINDAPVLAAADASVALDAGTALARASGDAVSLGNRLGTITNAAKIAKATRRVIRQNLAWAILYNATAVPLAVSGYLAPWMAAIGMSASSLLVVLNALRLHRVGEATGRDSEPEASPGMPQEVIS